MTEPSEMTEPTAWRRVAVEVSTLWCGADRPRSVDVAMILATPDPRAWLATLDANDGQDESGDGRLGLHGRVDSQVVAGEPVILLGTTPAPAGWVEVACPWQPNSQDPLGYPGWLRSDHLEEECVGVDRTAGPVEPGATWPEPGRALDPLDVLTLARTHLGLRYLWGGTSPLGLDCSGLVHTVWRALGSLVPRDAGDQYDACRPIPLDEVRAGDLYFFSDATGGIEHVGIVTEPGRMIHAWQGNGEGVVTEEPLAPARLATLSHAGRLNIGR